MSWRSLSPLMVLAGFGTHTDLCPSTGWQVGLVTGRRQWRLLPQTEVPAGRDLFLHQGAMAEVTQCAGEVLVVPSGWTAQGMDLEPTLAVQSPCRLGAVSFCNSAIGFGSAVSSLDIPVPGLGEIESKVIDLHFRAEFERKRAGFMHREVKGVSRSLPSVLRRIWWINLSRRSDRRAETERALEAVGLSSISERVEAVDGQFLDLNSVSPLIATRDALDQARSPPERVMGVALTRSRDFH